METKTGHTVDNLHLEFEAWWHSQYISTEKLEWDGDGYPDFDHNAQWEAYKSATLKQAALITQLTTERDAAVKDAQSHNYRLGAALNRCCWRAT